MKSGVIVSVAVVIIILTLGVVWMVREKPPIGSTSRARSQLTEAEKRPVVSKSGPHPKAVMEETTYEFGRIELGDKGSYAFTIRNEGKAPLELKKGPTTCQCTVSELENGQIEPGGSATITLTWEPTAQTEKFEKGADIWTNDPDHTAIRLTIRGIVTQRVVTYPIGEWGPVELQEDVPTEFVGRIISQIDDDFEVTSIEIENPLVSAETSIIEDPKEFYGNGKFGYLVKMSFQPGMPVGAFSVPFMLRTDLKHRRSGEPLEFPLIVAGTRRGPIAIIGREWIEEKASLYLGTFNASDGKKATVTLLCKTPPAEGLKVLSMETDPEFLRVTLEQDEKATGKAGRSRLSIEFPAGSPRMTRLEDDTQRDYPAKPAMIKLHTNHPTAPDMQFKVLFNAF